MSNLNTLDWITVILVIVGAINWGLIGLFNVDVVARLFGDMSTLSQVTYVLVGLSGVYLLAIVGSLRKA